MRVVYPGILLFLDATLLSRRRIRKARILIAICTFLKAILSKSVSKLDPIHQPFNLRFLPSG